LVEAYAEATLTAGEDNAVRSKSYGKFSDALVSFAFSPRTREAVDADDADPLFGTMASFVFTEYAEPNGKLATAMRVEIDALKSKYTCTEGTKQ